MIQIIEPVGICRKVVLDPNDLPPSKASYNIQKLFMVLLKKGRWLNAKALDSIADPTGVVDGIQRVHD